MIAPFAGLTRPKPAHRPLLAPDPVTGQPANDRRDETGTAQHGAGAPVVRLDTRQHRWQRAMKPASRAPVEQFPSAWPNAPEDAQGIARTLSRGLP